MRLAGPGVVAGGKRWCQRQLQRRIGYPQRRIECLRIAHDALVTREWLLCESFALRTVMLAECAEPNRQTVARFVDAAWSSRCTSCWPGQTG